MRRESRKIKKVRRLIILCAITGMFLTVSTYAWFVGMKTVNVSSMDVDIATTEGLFLSMDGTNWSYTLDAKNATAYTGNKNTWAEDGLIPVSTVGDMDSNVSRMELYEKASLTTTKGGYRLLSSRVDNYNTTGGELNQGKGYIAFDLFIKNLSGSAYYPENNILNEEAVYLTPNSQVKVSVNGTANTGIENSVRVAFAEIGRVEATDGIASVTNITNISCTDIAAANGQAQVTGICRQASIWEPNDTKHVDNAINWYDKSCKVREGLLVNDDNSYTTGSCTGITNAVSYPTYAISKAIGINDNVDIYDGTSFNTYTANTLEKENFNLYTTDRTSYKLVSFPYLTDTMKNYRGTARPTFFSLAPNSITKVRVYIFIEGQDIDNYDFASLGKQISVNFGLTKERMSEIDIDYVGPTTNLSGCTNDEFSYGGQCLLSCPVGTTVTDTDDGGHACVASE